MPIATASRTNEYLPAGTYSGARRRMRITVDYKGGRNGGRGPNYQRLDFRAGYRFRLGGRPHDRCVPRRVQRDQRAELRESRNNATRSRIAATFLRITPTIDESPTRTAQINLRFGF